MDEQILVTILNQNNTALTTIAHNTEAVKNSISDLAKANEKQTLALNDIKNCQTQYQTQSLKWLAVLLLVELLIIGGLLTALNIKGSQAITSAVEKVLPGVKL